jgi:large subunit ribosomal protein L23
MKNPHEIILRPHITEKSVALSYGDPRLPDNMLVRKYTFEVAPDANKIEIKWAVEQIYNAGRKKGETAVSVDTVRTMVNKGKSRRVGWKNRGKRPDRKKAVVTLKRGQMLEDYGV